MNPEQLLNDVAVLINTAAKTHTGKIHIIRQGEEIRVVSSSFRSSPVKPIASYNAEDARNGLTVQQWSSLSRRLSVAAKEIEKCREQSKH